MACSVKAQEQLYLYLNKGVLSDSCSGRFNSGETVHGTHWIGGLVDYRAGLDAVGKRKNFLPLSETGSQSSNL